MHGTSPSSAHAAWMAEFKPAYASAEERAYRAGVFDANKASIDAHNKEYRAGLHTWFQRENAFTDLTHEEFLAQRVGGAKKPAAKKGTTRAEFEAKFPRKDLLAAPPTSVDWRPLGAVTPIKDQGQCGSCWAFATTVATEGSTFVNSSKLISLSEQQIVSCDKADGNQGCNGGDQLPAMQWLKKTGGQCSEADYPYKSGGGNTGKCETTCKPAVVITDATEVPKADENALMAAIALNPISLSVDASGNGWQSYGGGVYSTHCKCASVSCLDHGVGGVGYTDASWTVKNSWGTSWGEKGYILLARGSSYGPTGQCGVMIDNQYTASYPVA